MLRRFTVLKELSVLFLVRTSFGSKIGMAKQSTTDVRKGQTKN